MVPHQTALSTSKKWKVFKRFLNSRDTLLTAPHQSLRILKAVNELGERVHSTYAAMGGGGVWPLRTRLYKGGGGVWPLHMYAFYGPNLLIFP